MVNCKKDRPKGNSKFKGFALISGFLSLLNPFLLATQISKSDFQGNSLDYLFGSDQRIVNIAETFHGDFGFRDYLMGNLETMVKDYGVNTIVLADISQKDFQKDIDTYLRTKDTRKADKLFDGLCDKFFSVYRTPDNGLREFKRSKELSFIQLARDLRLRGYGLDVKVIDVSATDYWVAQEASDRGQRNERLVQQTSTWVDRLDSLDSQKSGNGKTVVVYGAGHSKALMEGMAARGLNVRNVFYLGHVEHIAQNGFLPEAVNGAVEYSNRFVQEGDTIYFKGNFIPAKQTIPFGIIVAPDSREIPRLGN